jgi:tetratricopeptide (TPR) repeat protein
MHGSNVADLFALGLRLYREGQLSQAESLLAKVIEADPAHFDALHLSGVIASQTGSPERAVALIRRAVSVKPDLPAAHRHLGNGLRDLNRLQEAVASYTAAIALRADFKEAYVNRGMVLAMLRRPAEALGDFDRAMALGADDFYLHTWRGSTLLDLKRPVESLVSCERAILQRPDFADAHVNRAGALHLLGQFADALSSCERALALQPRHVEAHTHRSASLYALGRLEEALAGVEIAVGLQPTNAAAHSLRATCLLDLQRRQEALASCDRAITLHPGLIDAHNTRGLALTGLQRYAEADASFDRAIALQPDAMEPYFNKGVRCLQIGDFEQGWELYERRPVARRFNEAVGRPRWDGREDIAGKRILIYSEQGLGDTLQFCRYAKLFEARGAKVILCVQESLCTLLNSLSPEIRVVSSQAPLPDYDLHCPLLSLPRAFATRLDSIPADVPYLSADSARVASWRKRLGTHGRLIGIRWQGSTGRADVGRSFPLRHFQVIADIADVRLISLQKGPGSEQLLERTTDLRVEDLGADFEPGGRDAFLDVAAVMECLELIITSDTSIAHLAGALGRPTWLALKKVPDWRWMLEREDSPWYPSMRVFRQEQDGEWRTLFERMRDQLE